MPVDVRRRIAAHVLAALDDKTIAKDWPERPAAPTGVYTFIATLKEQSRKSPITKT
jgi:hypothetical protein